MHPSQVFKAKREDALAIADAFPFATISAWDGEGLACVQAPLAPVKDQAGEVVAFEGHIARANRFAHQLADGREVRAIAMFAGPDAYVSPSSYASKKVHGRVVPTWNYIGAEAHGRLRLIDDADETLAILGRQTDLFEQKKPAPWSLDDADPDYLARLTRAIIGLRLDITALEATVKLSQDKAEEDFQGVIDGLIAQGDYKSRAIAARMSELERG
jgi:transcriptional regulator